MCYVVLMVAIASLVALIFLGGGPGCPMFIAVGALALILFMGLMAKG